MFRTLRPRGGATRTVYAQAVVAGAPELSKPRVFAAHYVCLSRSVTSRRQALARRRGAHPAPPVAPRWLPSLEGARPRRTFSCVGRAKARTAHHVDGKDLADRGRGALHARIATPPASGKAMPCARKVTMIRAMTSAQLSRNRMLSAWETTMLRDAAESASTIHNPWKRGCVGPSMPA